MDYSIFSLNIPNERDTLFIKETELYKHILIAVDLDHGGSCVAKRGLEIAANNQAKVILLNVVEPLPAYVSNNFGGVNIEEELLNEAGNKLSELGKELHIPVANQRVDLGSIRNTILDIRQELSADLIVIGSHGRHGIAGLLGSTVSSVLHHAPCDVLVVKIPE